MAEFTGGSGPGEESDSALSAALDPIISTASSPQPPSRRFRLRSAVRPALAWLTSGVWSALAWLGLIVAAWVGMDQVSAIVAEVTPTGQYGVTALFGIGQLGSITTAPDPTLRAWKVAGRHFPHLHAWLACYFVMDALFILALGMLAITLLRHRSKPAVAMWLLRAVIGLFTAEIILGAVTVATAQPVAVWLLHIVTEAKWLAVLFALAWLAYRVHASYRDYRLGRRRGRRPGNLTGIYADLRRLTQALELQRFSLVVVLLLGLIAVGPPLNDLFEQMPDVQRAWLDRGSPAGVWQMLIAFGAQLLVALMLFLLGRMRTQRARAKFTGDPDKDGRAGHHHLTWILVPLSVLILAAVLKFSTGAKVATPRVCAFSGTLLLIALVSWAVSRRFDKPLGRDLPDQDAKVVAVARLAGDALAVTVVGVTPIGVVRSFTAPALVQPGPLVIGALVLGLAGAFALPLSWPILAGVRTARARRHAIQPEAAAGTGGGSEVAGQTPAPLIPGPRVPSLGTPSPGTPSPGTRSLSVPSLREPGDRQILSERRRELAPLTRAMWTVGAIFVLADIFLIVAPLEASSLLGVLGTVVIAIGSLASLLGWLAYLAQTRLPLPIFRALRMNVTPVMSIILVIAIAGGIADKNSSLHQIRGPVARGDATRPTVSEAFAAWASQMPESCAVTVPGLASPGSHPVRIEPLVQIAASGGGIRAAWWAVKVLSSVLRTRCGADDVFAVSSVSGGSLGVAVLASVSGRNRHPIRTANDRLSAIAGPDALAALMDGLMLRDTVAGYTGIDVRAVQAPANDPYPDRAALVEKTWQGEDSALSLPFPLRQSWLKWALLFNSTSVATGCRAVISSISLPRASSFTPQGLNCQLGSVSPTGSYDFFSRLPCLRNIATSTAAMLSARFPYVTPSGTVTSCGPKGRFDDQLVDGGYGDATGLSTLINLSPALMSAVRARNNREVAAAVRHRGRPITLVVPVTVYLENSIQPTQMVTAVGRTPELDVPTTAQSLGPTTELTGTNALLESALAASAPGQWLTCGRTRTLCGHATSAAIGVVPDQVLMVAPREFPGVAAPLGWLLSLASRQALNQALARDIRTGSCTRRRTPGEYCVPGIGGLSNLLALTSAGG